MRALEGKSVVKREARLTRPRQKRQSLERRQVVVNLVMSKNKTTPQALEHNYPSLRHYLFPMLKLVRVLVCLFVCVCVCVCALRCYDVRAYTFSNIYTHFSNMFIMYTERRPEPVPYRYADSFYD